MPAVDAGLSGRLSGGGPQWVVRVLDLAAAHADEWPVDPVASIAPTLLAHTPARIPDVAERLGVGERHLRRRFAAAVGASPSAYRRLVRTRRALRDLGPQATSAAATIADIAHAHGFTEQSHLTREVVALTGTTPGALRRHRHTVGG